MKYSKLFLFIILFSILISSSKEKPILKFNENGTFKIVQFTDIHLGEDSDKDILSYNGLGVILDKEKPNFVMLSGDVITGSNFKSDERKYYQVWENLTKVMIDRNVPWGYTFGNHDAFGGIYHRNHKRIVGIDMAYNLSLTRLTDEENVPGTTNYHLQILSNKNNSNEIGAMIYIFDSEIGHQVKCEAMGCIDKKQVDWYQRQSEKFNKTKGIAFVHVPPVDVLKMLDDKNSKPVGSFGEEVCCFYTPESEFIDKMIEQDDIKALYYGHDHKNDFHGLYKGKIDLTYGRKSGFGGYSPDHPVGSRVIELTENPFTINTWIRNYHGDIETQELKVDYKHKKNECAAISHEKSVQYIILVSVVPFCGIVVMVIVLLIVKKKFFKKSKSKSVLPPNEKDRVYII